MSSVYLMQIIKIKRFIRIFVKGVTKMTKTADKNVLGAADIRIEISVAFLHLLISSCCYFKKILLCMKRAKNNLLHRNTLPTLDNTCKMVCPLGE